MDDTATTSGTGYYGGMRYGYGGGFTSTSINYEVYIEGTLFINFVDASTEKLSGKDVVPKQLMKMPVQKKEK